MSSVTVVILCSYSYGVSEDICLQLLLFICLGLLFFIMFIYYVHVHMGLMRTYVFGYCSSFDGILCSYSYGVNEDICLRLLFFI